jgi:transcription elongation GreA/GreB family factor
MIQIEREKNSKRIKEIENLKKQLIIIKSLQSDNSKVSPGSIILTSTNNYFISISSEIYSSDTSKFYCVSINTPIAKAYLGKMIGDIVTFNNIDSKIEKII